MGTGSHLWRLAAVINDVALNFGGRHFWAPLFTLILKLMDAFEEESSGGGGGGDTVCPGSQVVEARPTPGLRTTVCFHLL